ncbi:hypothetical protein TNCV_3948941 [Trichonephila clavipes]|nr:hypothetical protein TNCV_3948941 [Trichonephila clavipes]
MSIFRQQFLENAATVRGVQNSLSPYHLSKEQVPNFLKATANDRRTHLASCHDEFRGPGCDTVEIRQQQSS